MIKFILDMFPGLQEKDFLLQDDGDGVYISKWDSSYPKPTQEQLNSWIAENNTIPPLPTIEERIDLIEGAINSILFGGAVNE